MVAVLSNVNGRLEYSKINAENKTAKVKILSEDGAFHIYDNLHKFSNAEMFKIGDYIGETENLHYEVKVQPHADSPEATEYWNSKR